MADHRNCVVATCTNNGKKTKNVKIIYHRFPKDPQTSAKWLSKCNNHRDRNFNPKHAHICSIHFVEEDYERDLKNELLGLPPKRKLKKGAVPTVNLGKTKTKSVTSVGHLVSSPASQPDDLPSCSSISQSSDHEHAADGYIVGFKSKSAREKRRESRATKEVFREIWENLSPVQKTCDKMTSTTDDKMEDDRLLTKLQKEKDALATENRILRNNLQRSIAATQEWRKQSTILKNELKKAQSTRAKKNPTSEDNDKLWLQRNSSQIVESLSNIFSVSQMKYLVNRKRSAGQKRVHWTSGDIKTAKVLRDQSKKNFEYLRSIGYPFPGATTIRQWKKYSFSNQTVLCEEELESSVAAIVDAI